MASKRRRSETSPQMLVFPFSLDVRFQTESERKRSSSGLQRKGPIFARGRRESTQPRATQSALPKVYRGMGQLKILWRTLPSQPKVSFQYCCLHQGYSISVGVNVALTVLLSFCVGLFMPLHVLIFCQDSV